jgi:hypothetical protein
MMMKQFHIWSREVTRRRLLHHAARATGAAIVLGSTIDAAMAGKMPQSSVGYQPTPQGDHSCANCKLFEPPDACKSVAGPVSANGWCRIWIKK